MPILEVLCLVGLIQSIFTLNGSLFLSQGRANLQLKVSIAVTIVTFLGIIGGLRWGPIGVAWGYTAAVVLTHYPAFRAAGGLVDLKYRNVVRAVSGVLACSVAMGASVMALRTAFPLDISPTVDLAVYVAAGVLIYAALLGLFRIDAAREMIAVVRPGKTTGE